MSELQRALLSLLLLAAVFVPLERLFPARRQRVRREGATADLAFFFGQALLFSAAWLAVIASLGDALDAALPAGLRAPFEALPRWQQAVLAILLGDVCVYWFHRASHAVPALWRIHAVHHSTTELDWLAAHREHPLDGLLTQLAINLPGLVLGFDYAVLAGLVAFRGLWAIFIHSNVRLELGPLELLLGAPTLHRWHHRDGDGPVHNFANLAPWTDLLFGTFHRPPAAQVWPLGVTPRLPASYLGLLLSPLLGTGRRGRWALAAAALALALLTAPAWAEVPRTIGYQGFLRAKTGQPVDSAKELTFSLYDSPEGGSPRWTETQIVLFAQGHYTVFLGDASGCDAGPCTGLPPDLFAEATSLYLELVVDGAPFRPRQRLTAAPFALTARDVRGGSVVAATIDAGLVRADALQCDALDVTGVVSANGVSTGALSVSGTQTFGSRPGQHLNLYSQQYGLGVQSATLYLRTASGLSVHRGGSHVDNANAPGPGGTTIFNVTAAGDLTVPGVANARSLNVTTATVSGAVAAGSLAASGAVTAGSVSAAGAVSGATVTASGALNAGSATVSGPISGTTVSASGAVSAASVAVTGTVTAARFAGAGASINVYSCPATPGSCPDIKPRRCVGQLQASAQCTVWNASGATCVQAADLDCTLSGRLIDP